VKSESGAAGPRLVVLSGPLQGRVFALSAPATTIGRSPECEIQLDLASVSRQHARVEEQHGRFVVRDLGSRNGIRIGDDLVQEAFLSNGSVVSVGDVQLRFELAPVRPPATPPPAAASPLPASPAPLAAPVAPPPPPRALTGFDVIAATQGRPGPGGPPSDASAQAAGAPTAPRVGLNLKLIIAVVLGLILSVGAGFLWLYLKSLRPLPKRADLMPIVVRVGENKWIRVAGWQEIRVGLKTEWIRLGELTDRVAVDDDTVATAEKYGAGEILVVGKEGGETNVTLNMVSGSVAVLRVIVRGRLDDPLENLTYGRYTSDERKAMAERFLQSGMLIEAEKPYVALQEYEKALAVLKPVEKGKLFLDARERLAGATKSVSDKWDKLRGDITVAARNNDRPRQMQLLQEALKLIPDPNDPRHQKSQARVQQLIRAEIEEREHPRGK
jgi:hypothetical protein